MKREEQEIKNTWDLTKMYDVSNLDRDLADIKEQACELCQYQNKTLDKALIITLLSKYFKLLTVLENIYVYYSHQLDTDFNNSAYIAQSNYIKQFFNDINVKLAFIMPALAQVNDTILNSILEDENLSAYHKTIRDIMHNKKRYLSVGQEQIIAAYDLISSGPYQVFSAFANADLHFKSVVDQAGNAHELTEGTYARLIRSEDRVLRANAFKALLQGYANFNQTLATTFILELKTSYVNMINRHYQSTLEQALEPKQIDPAIYYNLLASVEKNIALNHQYMSLRQKELNLAELHLYDVYVPLVPNLVQEYTFDQAKDIVRNSLHLMNEEYRTIVEEAFNNRWIDVYENEGKRSGAYSGGSYTSYPYILLNYQGNINDVFTLAHELGHSLHSYLANKYNPYQNASYQIFVAEIASTVNELILINHLLAAKPTNKMKKYLLNYLLEQFRTTLVRQTMFARFELAAHELVEKNEPIANEVLNALYLRINQQYFGKDIVVDDLIKYEYTRIPHFYYNYYVYQYATSFSIALNIVKRIEAQEENIIERYLDFLKLGDSIPPVAAVATLDINLKDSQIFDEAMLAYGSTIQAFKDVVND